MTIRDVPALTSLRLRWSSPASRCRQIDNHDRPRYSHGMSQQSLMDFRAGKRMNRRQNDLTRKYLIARGNTQMQGALLGLALPGRRLAEGDRA